MYLLYTNGLMACLFYWVCLQQQQRNAELQSQTQASGVAQSKIMEVRLPWQTWLVVLPSNHQLHVPEKDVARQFYTSGLACAVAGDGL